MGIEITPRPRPPWSRSPPRSGPAPSSSRSCQARGRIIYSRLRAPGSNLELNLARKIFSRVPSIGLGWRGKTGSRVTMWAGFIIMHHRGSSQSPATSQKLFIPGPPLVFAGHRETLLYYQRRLCKTVKVLYGVGFSQSVTSTNKSRFSAGVLSLGGSSATVL